MSKGRGQGGALAMQSVVYGAIHPPRGRRLLSPTPNRSLVGPEAESGRWRRNSIPKPALSLWVVRALWRGTIPLVSARW
jgi:hypothetical protein